MIGDVLRTARRTAVGAARSVPVAGALLGRPDPVELEGRVVFVTGAARGLGAEVARQAHARGARVALIGRRLAPLEELAAEFGDRGFASQADVTDLAELQRAAQQTIEHFGAIDVVVANAGIAPPSETMLTIDPEVFERTVDVDLLGQWRTIRATLPAIIESGGHILVVASIYAFFNGALNASYAASKAGIEQLTRALRVELVHHGATAGLAYLGFIDTELAADVFAQEQVEEIRRSVPGFVTRPMTTAHTADVVLDAIERRAGRVCAPAWVQPMLTARGLVTSLMDDMMLSNPRIAAAIREAEHRNTPVGSPRLEELERTS